MSPFRWIGVAVVLAVATLVAYAPVTGHEFLNYDDDLYVTNNEVVREGLTVEGLVWAATSMHAANWHPLTWLSHMIDVEIHGLRPGGHHLTSVLIHIAGAVFLFLALARMTRAFWQSALVACLFALHPLHVESVAWIAERKDVLSGFLAMLTLFTYARYVERPGAARYVVVVATFGLGLLAKPMLVTLPFVLLLLDGWPLARFGKACILEKIPLFAMAAASSTITVVSQRAGDTLTSLAATPLPDRLANASISYVRYLGKAIWPVDLAIFYPLPREWPTGAFAASAAILLLVTGTVLALSRRRPWLAVGWLWYLGMLLPVIGLVRIGRQAMADRYTYLPLIGVYLLVAWGGAELFRRWRVPVAVTSAVIAAVPLVLIPLTRTHVGHFRDSITLFTHAIAVTHENDEAHFNLGNALAASGDEEGALAHFVEARRIRPTDARVHNNIGNRFQMVNRFDDAIDAYREALRLDPGHVFSRRNLAYVLLRANRHDEAADEYARVVEREPGFAPGHFYRGVALTRLDRAAAAETSYRRALELDRSLADAHWGLALALAMQGRVDEAEASFAEAVRRKPEYADQRDELERALRR